MGLLAIAFAIWGRVLSLRPGAPKWLRWFPPVMAVTVVASFASTAFRLVDAFDAVKTVPASEKAQVLSDRISDAMSGTVVGLVVLALSFVLLVAMTIRLRGQSTDLPTR